MTLPNDGELQRALKNLQEHTSPFDERFAAEHSREIDDLSKRLAGEKDKLSQEIKEWFEKHYHHIRGYLHEDREKIEQRLHEANIDIDKHLAHEKEEVHKCHDKIDQHIAHEKEELHKCHEKIEQETEKLKKNLHH